MAYEQLRTLYRKKSKAAARPDQIWRPGERALFRRNGAERPAVSEWRDWLEGLQDADADEARKGWRVLVEASGDPVVLTLHIIELHSLRFRPPVTRAMLTKAARAVKQIKHARNVLREFSKSQADVFLTGTEWQRALDALSIRPLSAGPTWLRRRLRPKENLAEAILRARLLRYVLSVAPPPKGRRPRRSFDGPMAAIVCLVSGRKSYPASAQELWRTRWRRLLRSSIK